MVEQSPMNDVLSGESIQFSGPTDGGKTKTNKKLSLWAKAGIGLGAVVLMIVIGYGLVALFAYRQAKPLIARAQQAIVLARETVDFAKKQDLVTADQKIKEVQSAVGSLASDYRKLQWLRFVPLAAPYYQDGILVADSAQSGVEAAMLLLDTVTPYADVLGFKGQGSFTGGTAEDRIMKIVQTLEKVTPKLDEVVAKIDAIDHNLSQINPQRYPANWRGRPVRSEIANAKSMLSQARQTLIETKPVIEVLPAVMGYPDKKKYLVLFQNDGELRPTGGFITAYSIFDVESGKARSARSDDIYSLDQKFGNKLPPPEVLKKYLNTQAWHLRDMNWSPDFQVSMAEFVRHYESMSGVDPVDGVIAIDTKILTGLIDVVGPVEVPGFGKFTNENDARCNTPQVVCALEYIVDEPLPDIVENRKSTILGPMVQELMFKAYGSPKQQWPGLFQLLLNSLKEKHALLYFKDEKIENAAIAFGAAGKIIPAEGDYLAVIDANLGGAKSNLYVTAEVEQKIAKENGKINKEVTLSYLHPEPMDDCNLERKGGLCLSGILRNYFRVYVPKGSTLTEALGSEIEVTTTEELDKTVFAGFFQLRGDGGRAKVILKYTLPDNLAADGQLPMMIQKQAGTTTVPHRIITDSGTQEIKLTKDEVLKVQL